MTDFVNANLAFFLESGDGTSLMEREAEILRIAFQTAGGTPYDRENGASFEDVEQEPSGSHEGVNAVDVMFGMRLVESVYRLNTERNWSPGIVVGFNEIISDARGNLMVVHRLMEDLGAEPGEVFV